MKTLHAFLGLLSLWGVLGAQNPWANWGIFRDSAGNGGTSVNGRVVCSDDTLWLIVDTAGMRAAGITGWHWYASGATPNVVYCTGRDCPPQNAPFPPAGLRNRLKLGIKPMTSNTVQRFLLTIYYANGDSASSIKSYNTRGGSASLSLPAEACPNTTVPGRVLITGVLDSFKVTYGSTTISNQTDFTIPIPPGSGSLRVTLTYYACGNSFNRSATINYPISVARAPVPMVTVESSECPTAPRGLSVNVPAGYTSFVWSINGNPVAPGTNHPTTYAWIPPGPGNYTISYAATYPCGTMSNSVTQNIGALPPPTMNVNVFPTTYCPGVSIGVEARASQTGVYTIDIGDDGRIEAYGPSYTGPVGTIPRGGLPIRVRFDNGCGGTLNELVNYNPDPPPQPLESSVSISLLSSVPRCPGSSIRVGLLSGNFPLDSIKNIQWSWDGVNWTPATSNPVATLTTPGSPGPWTLRCRFTATSPAPCLLPPSSPISTTIRPLNQGPQLNRIRGILCASGGTLKFVPDPSSTYAMDSIRYTLPDGTFLNRKVTDTVLIAVPGGTATYTLMAQGYTICGLSTPTFYDVRFLGYTPRISNMSVSNFACPNANLQVFVFHPPAVSFDSIQLVLWNNQRLPLEMRATGALGSFPGPALPGVYEVKVIGYSCAGNDTAMRRIVVLSSTQAVADFTAPPSACVGQPVTFRRTGSNAGILSASWSFSSSSASSDTSLSITHTYTTPGLYNVILSVQSQQCNLTSSQRAIRVYDAPPAISGLSITPSGLTISYRLASASDYDQIVWNFGDNNSVTGQTSGTHTYASGGTYTVTVSATNACGTTRLSQEVSVTTGLENVESAFWLVYPNPARQEIFIQSPAPLGEVRVELYDIRGQLVQVERVAALPGQLRLNVPGGLYTLRLIGREGTFVTKLMVE